jgi:hypothetical protein
MQRWRWERGAVDGVLVGGGVMCWAVWEEIVRLVAWGEDKDGVWV